MENGECFYRERDSGKIKEKPFTWKGPFAWPGYEKETGLDSIPDVAGVYLWTFEYDGDYLIYLAGKTKSAKKRFGDHSRSFKNGGDVYVLDPKQASKGIRVELWPWQSSKNIKDFEKNKNLYLEDVKHQLSAMRIFVAEILEERVQYRMEATIIHNIYYSKESWSELADRGMMVYQIRCNNEIPILAVNELENSNVKKIYGLFDK